MRDVPLANGLPFLFVSRLAPPIQSVSSEAMLPFVRPMEALPDKATDADGSLGARTLAQAQRTATLER